MAKRRSQRKARRKTTPKDGGNRHRIYLTLLLAFSFVYSIIFVGGPSFFGDDTVYANLAYYAIHGGFQQSSFIFSVRLLNIFPTSLFYYLFGINIFTDSAWDIVSFVGLIAVTYYLGKELHSSLAGIISAILIAFFPLIVHISATISDDIPLAFVGALAMLAILYAQKRNSRAWYFAAGILLVACPLITPEGLIVIITALAYLLVELLRKKIKINKATLALPLGIIVAVAGLMAFNYVNCANPFVTFTTNANFYSAVGQQNTIPSTNTDPAFYPNTMFGYNILGAIQTAIKSKNFDLLSIWNTVYSPGFSVSGLYFYVFAFAAAILILTRNRYAYFALFWFAISFLYLEFGPMHITIFPFSYLLSYRLARFLTIIAAPLCLAIGIFLASGIVNKGRLMKFVGSVFGLLVIGLLVLSAIPINMMWYGSLYSSRYDQIAISQYLSLLPNTTKIYFTGTFSNVPVYMQFSNMSRFFAYDSITNCRQIPAGSYVIIPKYLQVFGLNYTPDPTKSCPNWAQVLSPSIDKNFSSSIISASRPFRGNLYLVKNAT